MLRRAGVLGEFLSSSLNSTDTTERNASMLRPRPAPVASLVELATGPGSAWSWSSLPPTAGSPQLLGHDLHDPPHDHGIERVRRTPHLAYSFLRRTDLSVS
jgi:hypothetical protein